MSKENKVYFCGGVNGVGKSSFLQTLILNYPDFEIYSGSKKFMEWLCLKPNDYESLRGLNDRYKNDEMDKMLNKLLKERKYPNKKLIIDGHYFNYNRGDVVDCIGNWISLVDALFVITASPETILKRIKADERKINHQRNLFPANITDDKKILLIDKFLNITLNKAKQISKKYNLPLINIDNNKDGFDNVIEEFIKCESNIF